MVRTETRRRAEPRHDRRSGGEISADGTTLRAWVIPTDEELLIARDTLRLVERVEVPSA
jgi:acetate kinase